MNLSRHDEGDIQLIQSNTVVSGNESQRARNPKISDELLTENDYLRAGDILFPAKGVNKEPYIVKTIDLPAVASSTFFVIRPDFKIILPGYLSWYLKLSEIQHYLGIIAEGSTISSISIREFRTLKVKIPPLSIQQRIIELEQLQASYQDKLNAIGNKTALLNMEISKKIIGIENE